MSYEKRGVSAQKTDVHNAIKNLDKGIFPNAFCKILPDISGGDDDYCNLMHADTAGTKTSLAYMYWRETGNLDVWKGIVQDAIVMNLDDMACTGIVDDSILSSTIGRNKSLVNGDVVKALIEGTSAFAESMAAHGINIHLSGGETADVGDIVRTIDVGFTAFARAKRSDIININIQPGDVVVGLASYGKATYETEENSGIGSNGLTYARHELLDKLYAVKYPESYSPEIDKSVVYTGNEFLTTAIENTDIGRMLLSPTRTFLPVLKQIIAECKGQLNGIIHNTGGGQTKVLHFINNLRVVKDNLLPAPLIFRLIQSQRNADWQEMYQVFNMGQRMEFYTDAKTADCIIAIANSFNIEAQITGHVEAHEGKEVMLNSAYGEFIF
ncbi:MAG: phosphoribosylformylglycinamidine cyclo-ligase [Bacteroidetes bacterium]|nr:phosphoribosylformylglycinamidine cyclo-ligase [Bacteroidota bacterium]